VRNRGVEFMFHCRPGGEVQDLGEGDELTRNPRWGRENEPGDRISSVATIECPRPIDGVGGGGKESSEVVGNGEGVPRIARTDVGRPKLLEHGNGFDRVGLR
jgi:hypothetical protein